MKNNLYATSGWNDCDAPRFTELEQAELLVFSSQEMTPIPRIGKLSVEKTPGFFVGLPSGPGNSNYFGISRGSGPGSSSSNYFGISQGAEGNILVVGGNGSSKSAGIAKPTLRTWQGAICAADIKGELSEFYKELYQKGLVTRPYIIFDPTQIDGPSFDPFWWPLRDGATNLIGNIKEIATAIAPVLPDDKQPFWAETEQGVLSAALLYYFELRLSFSEAICKILSSTMSELCEELVQSHDTCVRMFLGEMAAMKPETLSNVDRGLRNKLMLFATDPYISHAFRGRREGANCFTWEDLDTYNIFLRIPADRIEEWGGAINLMYTQLIRHMERRPEMYRADGVNNVQTLLLMDEFARFGKLEMITDAMATLRSKNVNICLMIQSIAQLDKIYGEYDRRIIFDNCQYQVILRANDADTQKYLCDLIGTRICGRVSVGVHVDGKLHIAGFNGQISEDRKLRVQPHELATLDDVLLLSPCGFNRVKKFRVCDKNMESMLFGAPKVIYARPVLVDAAKGAEGYIAAKNNEGAKIMSIEERTANADRRVAAAEQKKKQEERNAQEAQRRKDSHRHYIIGELVARYFPDIRNIEPGTDVENQNRFEPLEAFLYVLSTDYDLYQELQDRAAQLVSQTPDGEWRLPM